MKWLKSGIFLATCLSVVWSAPTPFADEDSLRLPKSSSPISYDLTLRTDVHAGLRAFSGNVKIEIQIEEITNVITLHNRRLVIQEILLFDQLSAPVAFVNSTDTEKEFLVITRSSGSFAVGQKISLEIAFSGTLQTGTSGFYRSSYRVGAVTRYLAATQFESTNARSAFPCYDEPGFKATFKLAITHGSEYNAISNTEGVRSNAVEGVVTTTFPATPTMSSYLLAFIVSDFTFISNEIGLPVGDTLHRIHARTTDVGTAQYALEASAKYLKELERYAKYTYELDKMDSAAVPDFGAGAMENWGLITYKEQYLLGDANSHPRDVLEILKTVAHELGHQFFGNVVTCKWWDQIWLNEGFATLFEFLLVENVDTDLRMRDYFNVQKLQNAFRSDSLETTRPMRHDAETPSGISGLFDRIAYDKSGSVIRMFQNAVGENIFRDALSLYLNNNKHKSVTSDELYAAFETIISQNFFEDFLFTRAFKSWEDQKGFPLIHVKADGILTSFVITQERYYAASEERVTNDNRAWYIPLNFAYEASPNFGDTKFSDYFPNNPGTSRTISFPIRYDTSQWFIFNKQQMGYYRVNYDIENWEKLIKVLNSDNFQQIHVLNRAQLVDDSLTLAADGYLSYQIALDLVSYLARETDYIPWRAAVSNLDKLDTILTGRTPHGNLKVFIRKLVRRLYAFYGLEERPGDTLTDKFARELAIDWSCRMGDIRCLAATYAQLKKIAFDNQIVPDSLEITFICNGLRGLNRQDEFVAIFQQMQVSEDQAKRLRIIDGLLCSSDPKLLRDLLETTLVSSNEVNYRTHERTRILNNVVSRSEVGMAVMIDFIVEFYDEIVSMYSASAVDSLIIAISRRVSLYDDQVTLTNLIDSLEGKLNANTKTSALKNIDDNKVWIEGDKFFDVTVVVGEVASRVEEIENQLRLPKTSVPLHYKLHIDCRNIHTGLRAFTGEVEIDVLVKETTDYLMIHSKTQVIDELIVRNKATNAEIQVLDYSLFVPVDTLTIYMVDPLQAGTEIVLHIKYSTNLPTFGSGFYQTSYSYEGVTRFVGATQFQASNGRYAFPHYDEPGYKTVFDLKITHDASVGAIANTFGEDTLNPDGTITTTFGPTPLMSSYLLAFVVSDFEMISNELTKQPADTLHRIWVRQGSSSKSQFALENSAAVLKALEEYIGFGFELPKVDSTGIPNKGGAMENWGMVTYWETAMIYEENYDDISHSLKLSGVDVISHELAHQFFGDSVTCEWWDVTWLNEGFATLFEFHLTDMIHPEWNTKHFFNIRKIHNAFRFDSGSTTRSMTFEVLTPAHVSQSFNTIGYDKSGSVLRMFQYVVGEEIFIASLKLYLETYNHQSVVAQNLIDSFEAVMTEKNFNDLDFERAFKTWELQAGYPIIHVSFNSGQFQITQQRYRTNKADIENDQKSWYIPLNFATASNPDFDDTKISHYFVDGQDVFTIAAPAAFDASQWFVFNKQQMGYYRVNYDAANWNAIISALNSDDFDKIHVLNRVQLIDDAINFAAGGYIEYDVVFRILRYLSRETEYTPWYSADRFISTLYTALGPSNNDLNKFVRHISEKFYDVFKAPANFIIPSESVYIRYGREISTKLACNSGNMQCLSDTFNIVDRIAKDQIKITKGLETVTFCSGYRGLNKQSEWVTMWNKMQATTDSTQRSQFINSLGCSDDPEVLKDFLESTLGSGNSVSYTQAERRAIVSAVLNSHTGLAPVVTFFKDFELDILRNFGYGTLQAMITVPARVVKTREQQTLFNDYLSTLTHLEDAAFRDVSAIVSNNFAAQATPQMVSHIETIRRIVVEIEEMTTVPATTTTTAATTTTAQPGSSTDNPPTTTLGAATVGVKLFTLFACLLVAFVIKQ